MEDNRHHVIFAMSENQYSLQLGNIIIHLLLHDIIIRVYYYMGGQCLRSSSPHLRNLSYVHIIRARNHQKLGGKKRCTTRPQMAADQQVSYRYIPFVTYIVLLYYHHIITCIPTLYLYAPVILAV